MWVCLWPWASNMQCRCAFLSSMASPALQFITHHLIYSKISKKKSNIEHKMCVSIFFTTFVWNISHSKKNSVWYDHTYILIFVYSACYGCQIWIKFEISRRIFEKYSNVIFHENPSSGSRVVPCEQTDGHEDAYCSFASAPNNCAFCPHSIYVFCVYMCFRT